MAGVSAEAQALLATLSPQRRGQNETLDHERRAWVDHASTERLARGTYQVEDMIGGVSCLWVRPEVMSEKGTVIYVHGGGLTCGSPITHRAFASRMAARLGLPILLVDYRLLPDHPLPAARDDVLAVIDAVLKRNRTSRTYIAGDSNGAGLMLSALMERRDRGLTLPARSVAICGAFDATLSGESHGAALDPSLSPEVLADWQRDLGQADRQDPSLSPLRYDVSGLPPLLLIAGGLDMWLSDSLRLAEKVEGAGGDAVLKRWPGMWHCWPMYGDFREAREALDQVAMFLMPGLERRI